MVADLERRLTCLQIFVELNVKYLFYADDKVVYFVYNNNVTQEVFDSKFGTLQKSFSAKLRLNTNKIEFKNIALKSSMVCDIQLPMDSILGYYSYWDNVKFLGFLDEKLSLSFQAS